MRWVLAMVALASASQASAAEDQQFDLVCKGGKAEMHYRLDLEAKEYCFGACAKVMRIAEVTSGTITLYDNKPTPPYNVTSYNTISRMTGAWTWYGYDPRYGVMQNVRGACEKATFSGLGGTSRKF